MFAYIWKCDLVSVSARLTRVWKKERGTLFAGRKRSFSSNRERDWDAHDKIIFFAPFSLHTTGQKTPIFICFFLLVRVLYFFFLGCCYYVFLFRLTFDTNEAILARPTDPWSRPRAHKHLFPPPRPARAIILVNASHSVQVFICCCCCCCHISFFFFVSFFSLYLVYPILAVSKHATSGANTSVHCK